MSIAKTLAHAAATSAQFSVYAAKRTGIADTNFAKEFGAEFTEHSAAKRAEYDARLASARAARTEAIAAPAVKRQRKLDA